MSGPRWTLAAVTYHWADAYLITYTRDRWVALCQRRPKIDPFSTAEI